MSAARSTPIGRRRIDRRASACRIFRRSWSGSRIRPNREPPARGGCRACELRRGPCGRRVSLSKARTRDARGPRPEQTRVAPLVLDRYRARVPTNYFVAVPWTAGRRAPAFSGAPATYVTVGPFRYGYGYDPSTRDRAAAGPGARTATAAARKLLA